MVQLRLLAGLHRIVLRGEAPQLAEYYPTAGGCRPPEDVWPAAQPVLVAHATELAQSLAAAPQTNEPGRSAALLVGVLHAVRRTGLTRVRLLEVGASAGLNLLLDRFRFTGRGWSSGPAESPLVLHDAVLGPVAAALPEWSVRERRGCDLQPVDLSDAAGRLRLQSFVWPDHVARFERLRAALQVATAVPVQVDRAPAAAWLRDQLARPFEPEVLTVVWQSMTRMYWPPDEVSAVGDALGDAAERIPLAHVAMEYGQGDSGAELRAEVSDAAGRTTTELLARVADHGIPVRLEPGVVLGT